MKSKKLKAYEYKTFAKARVHGYTKKQFEKSSNAKKAWDNLSDLKKEIILDRLKENRQIAKFRLKARKEDENLVDAYEIKSQSHYDFRNKKVKSDFEYTLHGYFTNAPNPDKMETICKNSLVSAMNSGKVGQKRYLKKSLFSHLVDNNIKGMTITKVKVDKSLVTNSASAELIIKNNGRKWTGKN